jgi:hypothetical protein
MLSQLQDDRPFEANWVQSIHIEKGLGEIKYHHSFTA